MSELFLSILNMSLTASYVIIFIVFIRLPLPRNTNAISIPRDIIYQQSPQINSGIEVVDSFVGSLLPIPATGVSVNPLQIYVEIGTYIWILGIAALLVYSFVSIFLLKKQLKNSDLIEGNIIII